jgi:hypothetical protein
MHYSREDLDRLNRELKKKGVLFGVVLALYIALSVYFVIARLQLLCTIVSLIVLPVYFFLFAVFLLPPIRYHRFLRDVFEARRHERELVFLRSEPDADVRDGVRFRPIIVLDEDGFEHRLYWDELKPLPPLEEGQKLKLTTFGQSIVALD